MANKKDKLLKGVKVGLLPMNERIKAMSLENKRKASKKLAKEFSMVDVAYGLGLKFNKHKGGK